MDRKVFIILLTVVLILSENLLSRQIKFTDKNSALVLGRVVNVRNKPDIQGEIISKVRANEHVKIIKWMKNKVKIGRYINKWVKIKTAKEKIGYIFGAFIFDFNLLFTKKWTGNPGPVYAEELANTLVFKKPYYFELKNHTTGIGDIILKGQFFIKKTRLYLFYKNALQLNPNLKWVKDKHFSVYLKKFSHILQIIDIKYNNVLSFRGHPISRKIKWSKRFPQIFVIGD